MRQGRCRNVVRRGILGQVASVKSTEDLQARQIAIEVKTLSPAMPYGGPIQRALSALCCDASALLFHSFQGKQHSVCLALELGRSGIARIADD